MSHILSVFVFVVFEEEEKNNFDVGVILFHVANSLWRQAMKRQSMALSCIDEYDTFSCILRAHTKTDKQKWFFGNWTRNYILHGNRKLQMTKRQTHSAHLMLCLTMLFFLSLVVTTFSCEILKKKVQNVNRFRMFVDTVKQYRTRGIQLIRIWRQFVEWVFNPNYLELI